MVSWMTPPSSQGPSPESNPTTLAFWLTMVHGSLMLWGLASDGGHDGALGAAGLMIEGMFVLCAALSALALITAWCEHRGVAMALLVLPMLGLGIVALGLLALVCGAVVD